VTELVAPAVLDAVAARATAPASAWLIGGWQVRVDPDVPFRRSNSTVPLAGGAERFDVEARIDEVEAIYRARGAVPRFQITPAADPGDLDDRLAARGYVIEAPVEVLVADLTAVAPSAHRRPPGSSVTVLDHVEPAMLATFGEDRSLLDRICAYGRLPAFQAPSGFVAITCFDGVAAAIGFGVVDAGWLGVFGMSTRASCRRRGAARLVLGALEEQARQRGVDRLYLQVEVDNTAARRLYASVGGRQNHRYHYRTLDESCRDAPWW